MSQPLDVPALVETLAPRVEDLLRRARARGASAAQASIGIERGLSATVRLGEVETLEYHHDRGLTLTVYRGHAKGTASTTDLSPEALEVALEAALAIARHTAEDPCAGLPDPERLAREIPDLDLHHPWDLEATEAVALAKRCEDAARAADPRIRNSEGATLSTHEGLHLYANTHGFLGHYPTSRHSLSCAVIAEDESGMQRDYWYDVSRVPQALAAPETIGEQAAARAVARLRARPLPTREVPVVFAAEVAAGLLRHYTSAVRGANLYRRTSFLVDGLGRQVFPEWLEMREEPHLPRALASAPFDSEGVATRPRTVVERGRVAGYFLDSYAARRLGMETTGNAGGIHNLIVTTGPLNRDGLLREMGTGLLVTELMGQGVNLVTGDYSRGAAGFWVENGEIQHPVEEVTVAGNLKDMFATIEAVGADVDTRRAIRTGSICIGRMTVAGRPG